MAVALCARFTRMYDKVTTLRSTRSRPLRASGCLRSLTSQSPFVNNTDKKRPSREASKDFTCRRAYCSKRETTYTDCILLSIDISSLVCFVFFSFLISKQNQKGSNLTFCAPTVSYTKPLTSQPHTHSKEREKKDSM